MKSNQNEKLEKWIQKNLEFFQKGYLPEPREKRVFAVVGFDVGNQRREEFIVHYRHWRAKIGIQHTP